MSLATPMPFTEALDAAEIKTILPTTGDHAALTALAPEIKRHSLYSATVSFAQPLEKLRDGVNAILTGQSNQTTVRAGIAKIWDQLGFRPDPDHEGGLQDVTSRQRIDLQIETNVQTAQGFGWFTQGNQADVLFAFPAQEIYRLWEPKGGIDAERDWPARWIKAGGPGFQGTRMVALKSDPVWQALGDPDLFPDGLDNPWPPFALHSGMDVQDVSRAEAVAMDLMKDNTSVLPRTVDFSAALAALPILREKWLRDAIVESGLGNFVDGVLQFAAGGAS